jgi:hypothetical protein
MFIAAFTKTSHWSLSPNYTNPGHTFSASLTLFSLCWLWTAILRMGMMFGAGTAIVPVYLENIALRFDAMCYRGVTFVRARQLLYAHVRARQLLYAHVRARQLLYAHVRARRLLYAHIRARRLLYAHVRARRLLYAHVRARRLLYAHVRACRLLYAHVRTVHFTCRISLLVSRGA